VISEAQRAEVRRLFYAEHWRIGTIASELGLHADTVRGALETARFNTRTLVRRRRIDPYLDFLHSTLEQYLRLRATRLHEMIVARGFSGSVQQTRRGDVPPAVEVQGSGGLGCSLYAAFFDGVNGVREEGC